MRTFVTLASIVYVAYGANQCNPNAFDKAAEDIILLGSGPVEPITKADVLAACDKNLKSLKFATDYAETCTSGLGKGMIKLFLEGTTNVVVGKCTEGNSQHEDYIKVSQCLITKAGAEIHQCNRKLGAALEGAANGSLKKHKVPQSCCYVGAYVDCVATSAKKCGPDAVEYVHNVIDAYAGDLLSTICVKWKSGSKNCKDLPKLTPAANPKFKTLLPPLAEVLDSLQA